MSKMHLEGEKLERLCKFVQEKLKEVKSKSELFRLTNVNRVTLDSIINEDRERINMTTAERIFKAFPGSRLIVMGEESERQESAFVSLEKYENMRERNSLLTKLVYEKEKLLHEGKKERIEKIKDNIEAIENKINQLIGINK